MTLSPVSADHMKPLVPVTVVVDVPGVDVPGVAGPATVVSGSAAEHAEISTMTAEAARARTTF